MILEVTLVEAVFGPAGGNVNGSLRTCNIASRIIDALSASMAPRRGMTNGFCGGLIPCLQAMRLKMALESHVREIADKHQRIQELIEAEMAHSAWDELRVAALKKEKLRLKDELERLRAPHH